MFSDTETSHNFQHGLHRHIESKAPRWEGETQVSEASCYMARPVPIVKASGVVGALQVDDDAFLRMREVYLQMKKKEQEDQQKMREYVPMQALLLHMVTALDDSSRCLERPTALLCQ